MKKYLIVLAAAVFALASCNKDAVKYTRIAFEEPTITIGEGSVQKLQLIWEPNTIKEAPVCVWASSDTTKVIVDQSGNIGAVAIGEANITATFGEGESALKAVCKVIVKDPLDIIVWGGWSLWDLDKETILSTDTILKTLSSGEEVKCVMIPASYKIWDNGIYLGSDYYLHGAGYSIDVEGTALLITDDLGQGPNYYYLGVSRLELVPASTFNWNDTAFANCAMAGALGDAATHFEWLDDTLGVVEQQFTGKIAAIDFENGKYLDFMSGIAGTGVFVGDEDYTLYKFNASWFEEPQMYGLLSLEDYSDFVQPYTWAPQIAKYYELLDEEEAPKYTVKEFKAPKQDLSKFTRTKDVFSKK